MTGGSGSMKVTTRSVDPHVLAIVDQALAEHFTVRPCATCGGPEIASKRRPLARCFNCGVRRELAAVPPAVRRWRCDRCRRFFYAVLGLAACPACRDRDRQQVRRERARCAKQATRRTENIGRF
jgi:hypothetical protein